MLSKKKLIGESYFSFNINNYVTDRQNGQILNINIFYKYATTDYFDYIPLREDTLKIIDNHKNLDLYWDILAKNIGDMLYNKYLIKSIKVTLGVDSNEKKTSYEPGKHEATYILGDIMI